MLELDASLLISFNSVDVDDKEKTLEKLKTGALAVEVAAETEGTNMQAELRVGSDKEVLSGRNENGAEVGVGLELGHVLESPNDDPLAKCRLL